VAGRSSGSGSATSARYRFSRDEAGERVNLHFSLALWRALNAGDEPVFELG
jgi:hypothetical protein